MWPLMLRLQPAQAKIGDGKPRSYGKWSLPVQSFALLLGLTICPMAGGAAPVDAASRPIKVVALGDSLTAGLGLAITEAFPARLAKALAAKGYSVEITNAGASGDTASDGLARVDWSVPEGTNAVILELGANDALRAIDPKVTRRALGAILARLSHRRIPVLLCGMRAPRNLGPDYVRAFDSIFPDLAAKDGLLFYPFFLQGVFGNPKLNQPDGLHPNAAGVDVIVSHILPSVEQLLARLRSARHS